ncbi:DUF1488 domain-containing protein (plasmid) [Caballeronia sp. NK8]|nr:DUF1488 domain-containing protein [Caballeronia sp. NK8]
MNIRFLPEPPAYLADEPALMFGALVDGRRIDCTISAEALEEHFGAASSREDDLQCAFEINRAVIEGAAEQLLTSVGCTPVLLRSGYFRFSGGGTPAGTWKQAHSAKERLSTSEANLRERDAQGAK